MTATPEQWAAINELAEDGTMYGPACIVELRERIEALEAAATREKANDFTDPDDEQLGRTYQAPSANARDRGQYRDCHVDGLRAVYNPGRSHGAMPADFDPEQARALASLLEKEADEDIEFGHTHYIDFTELRAAAELLRTLAADEVKPVAVPPVFFVIFTDRQGNVIHPDLAMVNGITYEVVRCSEMNESRIIRRQHGNAYSIKCRKGLWSVLAPTQQQAEREAYHYWFQYHADGEYDD